MWNKFYQNKQGFVASSKERHYISVEFKNELQSLRSEAQKECRRVVGLEAGCGVGHAIAPLLAEFADISFIALDISPKAISLLKVPHHLPVTGLLIATEKPFPASRSCVSLCV